MSEESADTHNNKNSEWAAILDWLHFKGWTKDDFYRFNEMNKKKYDDMIARGIKPKQSDFFGS